MSIRSHNYSNNNNNKDFINFISETCSVYSDYALFDIDCAFYVLLSKSIHGYSSNLLPEPIFGQTKPSEPHLEVVSIVSSVSMIQCIHFTFSKTNKRTGSGFKKSFAQQTDKFPKPKPVSVKQISPKCIVGLVHRVVNMLSQGKVFTDGDSQDINLLSTTSSAWPLIW